MRTVIFQVFLTLWTFISVLSVNGIRVPTNWNDVNQRNGAEIGYVSQRFSRRNDGPGSYATESLGRRDFANNVQDTKYTINSPYQSLQQNIPMVQQANSQMILSPHGLYIVPQSQKDSFPLRQNSRFTSEVLKNNLDNRYQSESQHAQSYVPTNKSYKKYQQIPDNVLGIQPLGVVDKYQQLKEAQKMQEVVNRLIRQYNPELFKQYPETSSPYSSQPLTDLKPWALPQNHQLIVSAPEEDATLNPLGFKQKVDYSTKKEPVFFVTEGYTNVLLQGPHHKNKYVESNQNITESNDVTNEQKLENDDKTPHKRKVTKIYRIHNNLRGSRRNLVETDDLKPVKARYFQRPELYNDEERRMGLEKHLRTNYRDDTLHESTNDKDDDRDDNEDERILSQDDDNDKILNDEVTEAQTDVNTTAEEEKTNATTESNDEIKEEEIADKSESNVQIKKSDHEIENVQQEEEQTEANLTNKAEGVENKEGSLEDQEEEIEENDDELNETDEKNQNKQVPHSEHVDPKSPPTKPIYPGEGFWANPGLKHRPHISQHRFFRPAEQEQKPDGYNVFEDLEQYFERQKDNFGNTFSNKETTTDANSQFSNYFESIRTPSPVNPIPVYDPFIESSNKNSAEIAEEPIKVTTEIPEASTTDNKDNTDSSRNEKTESSEDTDNSETEEENEELEENEEDTDSEDEEADDFVPLKLYTQVRNHENVEHEPYNPLEHGRLREVIKDSKVQTVYTEEGYEDAAYDHAGHEKNAEKDQGYAEFERVKKGPENEEENVKAKASDSIEGLSKHVPVLNDAKNVLIDSLASDSSFPLTPKENTINDSDNKKLQNNNFISTQEVKTTQVKNKPNGNMELEIESEVKVIMQPNNSSESHKYVKIYPKVHKEIEKEHKSQTAPDLFETKVPDNETEKDSSTTESSTVSEIESITKEYSTHKPRVVVKAIDKSGALRTIIGEDKIKRTKRSVELSPFGGFDTDLKVLKNINHTFEPAKPEIDVEKYPYYVLPDLNEDSPLRYAENFDKVPKKTEGELSFYKAADKHECPEIPQSIDPIPENVKNAHLKKGEDEETRESEASEYEDENHNDDEEESVVDKKRPATPKTPRIQLGDKIDCLKARYFGENPLDSPFFKEETVGPVKPIFKDFERSVLQKKPIKNIAAWRRSDDNVVNTNEVFDQSEKVDTKIVVKGAIPESISSTEKAEAAESMKLISKVSKPLELQVNDVAHEVKPTASPLVTLITTPRYTIQLTPKNIYDQIKLLDHLPEDNDLDNASKDLNEKIVEETTALNINEDGNNQKEESSKREPKILVGDVTGPEAEALRRRRMRPRRPAVYQIFDVNRFLTTTPFNLIDSASTTVLPKHKVLSEVYYKDEIKPSEQLNVFADVLNNIQNSSKMDNVPMQSASDFAEPSAVIVSTFEQSTIVPRESTPSIVRVKKFQSDSSYSQQNNIEVPKTTLRPPAPTRQIPISYNVQKRFNNNQIPVRRQPNVAAQDFKSKLSQNNHYYSTSTSKPFRPIKPVPQLSTTTLPSKRKFKRRRKPSSTTTTTTTVRTTTNIHVPKQNTPSNHQPYIIDFIEDTGKVIGMVPPQNFEYRTIIVENSEDRDGPESYREQSVAPQVSVKPVTEPTDEAPPKKPLNRYLFPGLRPPVPQKVRPYSDYLVNGALVNENLLRRRVAHVGNFRVKREAARASYADLSRNRGRQTAGLEKSFSADDDVDDYVPHRPKNFHYDEKTGKIIYHNKPKPKEEEEEEEYEEIEVPDTPGKYLETAEDATHPTPEKVTTKELLATATPPPEGKGLLDFVLKLKNDPTYQFIPDPTTRKPGSEPDTTKAFATVDPKSTNPPEFLNILSKVKSDSNYKYIEDPKESKKKSKTTTPIPEEELEEEEEEEEEETLPSKRLTRQTNPTNIFNIGDFLPKIQAPISSNIPENFFKKHIIERIFPRLRYMTLYDIAKEKYRQTDLYKFISKHIQNSPGGQAQNLGNIDIFDIGDYLPKIKTVVPKTSIDYSKYKTIQRNHPKTTPSTLEEDDEEEDVGLGGRDKLLSKQDHSRERYKTIRRPEVDREEESIDRLIISEERAEPKIVKKPTTTSTTQRIVQLRRGTRPTTRRTTVEVFEAKEATTTARSTIRRRPVTTRGTRRPIVYSETTEKVAKVYPANYSTDSIDHMQSASFEKAKRVYRRRPVRIRPTTKDDRDDIDKIVRRSVDNNFDYVKDEFEKASLEDSSNENKYQAIREEILSDHYPDEEIEDDDASESKLQETHSDVEIIDEGYDKRNKHGGNYKEVTDEYENREDLEDIDVEARENSDAVSEDNKKGDDNDEIEARVELIENQENGVKIKEKATQSEDETVNKPYDQTKQRSNYESKKVAVTNDFRKDKDQTIIASSPKQLDVEVINQNYNKKRKHGGNYRAENKAKIRNLKNNIEVINNNFDKQKKHGGNYKSHEDTAVDESLKNSDKGQQVIDTNIARRRIDTHEDSNIDSDRVESPATDLPQITKRRKIRIRKRPSSTTEPTLRLSDVVPKPDHFYSDPQLPKDVNKLITERTPLKLQSEEVSELAQQGDDFEGETEKPRRRRVKLRRRKLDLNEEKSNSEDGLDSEEGIKVTKKPVFEKDPSKRLYYYVER